MKHKSVITAVLGLGLMAAGLYAMKHLSGQGNGSWLCAASAQRWDAAFSDREPAVW